MSLTIEQPEGQAALSEFVAFADVVNAGRGAWWPALAPMQLPMLLGQGPGARRRTVRPLVARDDGRIVARAAAVVDRGYIDKWAEPLGHVVMFEALPATFEATRALMDEATSWLRSRGMVAVRTGSGPGFDMALAIDDYESLPPMIVRQNPAYYHALLKEARFETERGWVDYKIVVTPDLVARWEQMLEGAIAAGFSIVAFGEVPEHRRVADFAETWEEAFEAHWGMVPASTEEFAETFDAAEPIGMHDVSVMAYRDDRPVGAVWALPQFADMAVLAPGRTLGDHERLNFLGIGVRKEARGQGVNLAMAAKCYLTLVTRGATHLSYTMVLDDNWPSRRTAEKLGGRVCANYVTYRRSIAPEA
jgi:GNAT superfamily N-acetyltransferase